MPDGFGAQQIRDIVASAEKVELEPPRPLMRELPPATPFPDDALGKILGPAARAINDRVRSPMAICGQSELAAANLAVQAHANVVLPTGGGLEKPVSCNFVTVAASGERKSGSDTEATAPIRKYEQSLREKYEADWPAYKNDKSAWDKARDAATRGAKDRATIKKALDAIGPEPKAPLTPMLTFSDPTFEGLCKLFAVGQPSLGLFAAEGGQFIGGYGMSQENKLRTAAGLSDLWDGGVIRRVRSGDGNLVLPSCRFCMHVMAQPGVAGMLFGDDVLLDQGLLSRMLVTAPDTAAGTRLHRDEQPETDRNLRVYFARLLTILEMPLPLMPGKPNELAPRKLPLSNEAKRAWIGFSNHVEMAIAPDGVLAPIAGLANKLPEHAARLAAVLTLVRDIDAGEISADEMAAGILLAQHYAQEALRLFGAKGITEDLCLAQATLNWMLSPSWGKAVISMPDLYMRGPNSIRSKKVATPVVKILEDHGWLQRLPKGAKIDDVFRRDAYCIIRG